MSALTVKEQKAGSRPSSGYPISAPTIAAHPLNTANGVKRPVLVPGRRQLGQFRGRRTSASSLPNLRGKRTIL